jgi:hypothetical protein
MTQPLKAMSAAEQDLMPPATKVIAAAAGELAELLLILAGEAQKK